MTLFPMPSRCLGPAVPTGACWSLDFIPYCGVWIYVGEQDDVNGDLVAYWPWQVRWVRSVICGRRTRD
jgi:hypothetical protein